MRTLKVMAIAAMALAMAVGVVAEPSFATPRLTTSTGIRPSGGAVTPFYNPIGNTTTSSMRVSATNFLFTIGGVGIVTCLSSTGLEYVAATHTRFTITQLDFTGCTDTRSGFSATVTTTIVAGGSAHPWFEHLTAMLPAGSFAAVIEIPTGSTISIQATPSGMACRYTVPPQSLRATGTDPTQMLAVSDITVVNTKDAGSGVFCPVGTATLQVTYAYRAVTAADRLRATTLS